MQTLTMDEAKAVLTAMVEGNPSSEACSQLRSFVDDIPRIAEFPDYLILYDQFPTAAQRAIGTGSEPAKLWFHALFYRLLEFEVESEWQGPVKKLVEG